MKILSFITKLSFTGVSKLNNNKLYFSLLFFIIFFYSFISYENITFDLYFNYLYEDYANFFKSFDSSYLRYENITFPLWGYGIIHLLDQNILLTLLIQQLFTFSTLIYLDVVIRKYNILNNISSFRLIILLSSSWFFFHTQMWPKSIAANLLLLSLIFLIEYFYNKNQKKLILASVCFGILHNFRSDYIYLSILIFFIVLFFGTFNFRSFKSKFIFPIIQLVFLVPWMIFTFNQIGKPLLTSTNSGHVLFIGLGQLPNNIWGITPIDQDQKKIQILNEKFNTDYSKLEYAKWNGYDENEFLKKEFISNIKKHPIEWIKKCLYAGRLLILDPFYVGNVGNFQENKISNIVEIRKLEQHIYNFNFSDSISLVINTEWSFTKKEIFQLFITVFTKLFGIIVFITSIIILLLSIIDRIKQRLFFSGIEIILICAVLYQISISIFAFHMPVYNSGLYIIYVLLSYLLFQKYLSIKQ